MNGISCNTLIGSGEENILRAWMGLKSSSVTCKNNKAKNHSMKMNQDVNVRGRSLKSSPVPCKNNKVKIYSMKTNQDVNVRGHSLKKNKVRNCLITNR